MTKTILTAVILTVLLVSCKTENQEKYQGKFYNDVVKELGTPEFLDGTDNEKMKVYFEECDCTMYAFKKDNYIYRVEEGRKTD